MTACIQPGCTGVIDGGYCTICGFSLALPAPPVPVAAALNGATPHQDTSSISAPTPGSTRSRASGSVSGRSRRGSLGAGLVAVERIPARDPASAILVDPRVPESKRFCSKCERPVGRSTDPRPARAQGYCRNCGHRFSFEPKLLAGDLVAGQYEVVGCLAHGGLGWIYLATDRNVGGRWVALKGVLDSGDADAMAVALAERRFLAEVDHPGIVQIYNFVQHTNRRTHTVAGYIVMEYVSGQSLKQLLAERRQDGQSLPLPVALAYAIEALSALEYLHGRGLVYCDFKPENVIHTGEQIRLIDLGGVQRIGDEAGPVYGTVGLQAPEIEKDGPSPSSDLYTVGRTLAIMTFDFAGYQTTHQYTLPGPAEVPLLTEHESFYGLLRRATCPNPEQRFITASEMMEQLAGVLREVLAVEDGNPRPAASVLFSPESQPIGARAAEDLDRPPGVAPDVAEIVAGLPTPLPDSSDAVSSYLALVGALGPPSRSAAPRRGPADEMPDWRDIWHRGLDELAAGRAGQARTAFESVCDLLPGELAPKLALAFAAEASRDPATAARYFQLVWTVDRSYVSAAFGLARARLAAGDALAAEAAVAAVPDTSSQYPVAQIAALRARLSGGDHGAITADDLNATGDRLSRLSLDPARKQRLTAEILKAAVGFVGAGRPAADGQLLGCRLNARSLRFGLESSYRSLARLEPDPDRRGYLVDLANEVRPRTWS
jgi:serine/threonine-protein kinase PknG